MDEFLSGRAAVPLAILQLPAEYQAASALSNLSYRWKQLIDQDALQLRSPPAKIDTVLV
jgi:hypothetical protein